MSTPRDIRWFLVCLAIALCSGCGRSVDPPGEPLTDSDAAAATLADKIAWVHDEFPDTPSTTVAALLARIKADDAPVIVDARAPEELAVSTIPGAVPVDEVLASPDVWRGRTLVVYCTVGYRSAAVTDQLRQAGQSALNLDGGITAWAHAGQTVVDPDGQPTRRIHTYSERWNMLPPGYTPTW
jgi:rhodanese-related sulfurtransferase